MAKVTQDQKVQVGGAKFNKPKLRLRTRLMETLNRIFTTRQDKLAGEKGLLSTPMDRRRMLLTTGAAAVLAACAPLPAIANPNEVPAEKSSVKYQTLSDASELEPYFKNAKGKMVNIKPGQTKKIGEYEVSIFSEDSIGMSFKVTVNGKKEEHGVIFASPLSEVNILALDMGNNHPMIKGTLLVFADNTTVYFQFFDKSLGAHSLAGVPLQKGKMREGPIMTGVEILKDGIDIVNAPVDLRTGDVIAMASLLNTGVSGGTFFKYVGPDTALDTRTVAMR